MGFFRRQQDSTDAYPFRWNKEEVSADIGLLQDLFEEGVYLAGNDIIYIRQENLNVESVFGEHLTKVLQDATPLKAFVEQTQEFDGLGDLFSKFGYRNSAECTLHIPKNLFHDLGWYPKLGDLVYLNVTKTLWEVESVHDDKEPSFHPLGQHISYILGCKTYLYDHVEASDELMADDNEHVESITEVLFGVGDKVENAVVVDVTEKNDPIEKAKEGVVDDSEKDPLGF